MLLKTQEQVRDSFRRTGISVAAWARAHDLNPNLVVQVIAGRRACVRGDSHRAAVLLGLKEGVIVSSPKDLDAQQRNGQPRRRAG